MNESLLCKPRINVMTVASTRVEVTFPRKKLHSTTSGKEFTSVCNIYKRDMCFNHRFRLYLLEVEKREKPNYIKVPKKIRPPIQAWL